MNVSDFIRPDRKKPWRRRTMGDTPDDYNSPIYVQMTQEDFLNEINESAHYINSHAMSTRPIYGPTGKQDKNGKDIWGIVGYDEIEATPVGLQREIISKKISHFSADGFWVASESDDEKRFTTLMSWFDRVGLKTAFIELVSSVFNTGDGAIYLYQTGDPDDPIDYEVFSYLTGSTLFPRTDINGKTSFARGYRFEGHDAVDLFYNDKIETWMKLDDGDESIIPGGAEREKSEDGYTLVRRKQSQVGSNLCQCIYFWIEDIPTGCAQTEIEKLEGAKTYVGEHLKGSSMPILFVKAEKMGQLPPSKFANRSIGVKGTSDSIAKADAKFLAPPDASNIATLHIGNLERGIRDTCLSVKIDPEVIKQGSDSSATMRILYSPEIQWAQIMWPNFFKSVKKMMLVFKTLVGKVEKDVTGYDALPISVGQNIYIPSNTKEAIELEIEQVHARVKSRRAAMQDIGNSHKGDYDQIQKEWDDEIQKKATAKSEFDESNPNNVDNQSAGKSIQQ